MARRAIRGVARRLGRWLAELGGERSELDRLKADRQRLAAEAARLTGQAKRLSTLQARFGSRMIAHLDRAAAFADWVLEAVGGDGFDLCIAHDSLSWEAARILQREGRVRRMLCDAVEHPRYDGRSAVALPDEVERGLFVLHAYERALLEEADCIVTCSPAVARWYRAHTGARSVVVRNCLDFVPRVADARIRQDCGVGPDDVLVLYPNTVFPGCGLAEFIDAMPRMPVQVHLAVMGWDSGGVRDELAGLVTRHGLDARVHWLEPRRPADLIRYRMGADLALVPLLPSVPNHADGLPNRVFEAIMSRLPVLASALPEVVALLERYDCGRAFPTLEAADIVSTLSQALAERAALEQGVERAAGELNWSRERRRFDPLLSVDVDAPRTLLLANKSMATNQRMHRFARAACEAGHEVRFLCLELPFAELRDERISYLEMPEEWKRRGPAGLERASVARHFAATSPG